MKESGRALSRELSWLAPFLCLGLIALALLRPWPVFPAPAHSRIVTDADGVKVAIPVPLRGVVAWASDFLQKTHAPEILLEGGGTRERAWFASTLVSRLYPQVLESDGLWNEPSDAESLLAQDSGAVYFGRADRRRLGLITFATWARRESTDETIFSMTRVMNAALGQEARGEAFIADYRLAFANLQQELQPQTLTELPSLIGVVCPPGNWSRLTAWDGADARAGVRGAAESYLATGREQDAERILAMNSDMIILFVGDVQDFLHDPRWQGLKAVRDRRVYGNNPNLHGYTFDLDNVPLSTRWIAELAHPERLQPKFRELLRDHYLEAYGYRLSDEEIDELLRLDQNRETAGYARFRKNALASSGEGPPQ